jgi:ketosteroid isomerase-like protein
MNATEKEVLQVIEEWNQSFEQNDVEKYFETIHDEITVFTPSNPYRIDGYDADRKEFEFSLKKGTTRCSLFQVLQPKVQIFGDTAVITYYQRGVYGPQGQERMAYLKETNVGVRSESESPTA